MNMIKNGASYLNWNVMKNKKTLLSNLLNLSSIKILEIAFPLFCIPLLIQSLGLSGYGELAFNLALTSFVVIVVNFGFDESATKGLSQVKDIEGASSKLLIDIFKAKIVLSLFSFIICLCISYIFDFNIIFILLCITISFTEVLNFFWYFQGIEKLKHVAMSRLLSRLFYLIFILIFIKEESDLIYIPFCLLISAMIGAFIPMKYIYKHEVFCFKPFFSSSFISCIVKSKYIFLSNIVIGIKDKLAPIVLGSVLTMESVAIYDLFNKLILVLNIPVQILNNSFFPRFCNDQNQPKSGLIKLMILYIALVATFTTPLIWFVLPKYFVDYIEYQTLLQVILLSPILYGISFFLAKNVLIVNGAYKDLFKGMILTTLFYSGLLCGLFNLGMLTVDNLVYLFICTYLFEAIYRYVVCYCKGYLGNEVSQASI